MSHMINSVNLVGFISRKGVDLKFTQKGTAVANFTLSVEKKFKKADKKDYNFIPIQLYGKQAEWLADNQDKVNKIGVTGELDTYSWDSAEGKKYGWVVKAINAPVVEWSDGGNQGVQHDFGNDITPVKDDDIPF